MSQTEQQINAFLQDFDQNTAEVMDRIPPKLDQDGNVVTGNTLFSQDAIDNQTFITARDSIRQHIYRMEEVSDDRAAYEANDKAENLVDKFAYATLASMESAGLRKAKLAESPWSDDYWGIYKGIIGARYADPSFPASGNWKQNFDYVRAHAPQAILSSGNAAAINRLSPAEKYDALVGDTNGTLTRRQWSDGKYFYDAHGSVETWMGICHGWAPAAYMLARPRKSVVAKTPNGIAITFYPSDIKALGSLLWANVRSASRFIGGRCNDQNPAKDPVTGRVTSSTCFDTNPGTWHLAVVNQIGASKRSMVMDVTYDYEVWNQPTYGYEYSYFNPQTRTQASTLAGATVSKAAFTSDKFKAYRSSRAVSFVGVAMRVSYVVETSPSQRPDDNPSYDAIQSADYHYDLELDASGKIIGGEWYTNKHPDFLWTPPKGTRATTHYDHLATGAWQRGQAVPPNWRTAAQQSSKTDGAPLAAIVEQLIQFANS
jgi:hypothetical protein